MTRINPLLPFAAYLILGIFYVFPSGLPQPADAVFILAAGAAMLLGGLRLSLRSEEVLAILALMAWTYGVNCYYFMTLGDPVFLKKAAFYVYNLGFFALALSAIRSARAGDIRVLVYGSFLALVMEVAIVLITPEFHGRRQIGTFNNPNQMAYWALLNTAVHILSVIACRTSGVAVRGAKPMAGLALLFCLFLVGESLSKAGVVAYFAMAALVVGPVFGLRPLALALIGGLFLALAVMMSLIGDGALSVGQSLNLSFIDKLIARFSDVQADDSLMSRGYFRLLEAPQYLIAGAGEAAFWRISTTAGKEVEIHSTPLHFITSYGIVGLGIFAAFVATFFRRMDMAIAGIVAMILIYGIAHNGLRFTHVWMVFALIAAAAPMRPRARMVPA